MSIVQSDAATTAIQKRDPTPIDLSIIERVVIDNDLKVLAPRERWDYYRWRCESIGLDPMARPFQYIVFNGKLTLYADKGCAEQLRAIHKISVRPLPAQVNEGIFCQFVEARTPDGRTATDMGAVPIKDARGEALANAMKKAMTQANRRATLALVGLGAQDLEDVEGVQRLDPKAVEESNLLPATLTGDATPAFEGDIDWQEPDKWPPDQPSIITAKVVGVQQASKGNTKWLKVTVEDGDEIVLTTFHLGTEPMLRAAVGKVCDIMYAKLEKSNRLLSVKEADIKTTA